MCIMLMQPIVPAYTHRFADIGEILRPIRMLHDIPNGTKVVRLAARNVHIYCRFGAQAVHKKGRTKNRSRFDRFEMHQR